jgi:hypothetical protein
MEHLTNRRKLGTYFPIVALLTILAGAALYWRTSGGLQAAWIGSPMGSPSRSVASPRSRRS